MRNHALLLLLIALLCFQACKKEDKKDPVKEQTEIPKDVLDKIKAQGFSTRGVVKIKEGYVIEGDIILSEKDLNELNPPLTMRVGETEQYRTTNIVLGLPRVITISISGLDPGYTTSLDEAIARYNALNLRITFQRVSSGADISIQYAYLGPGILAGTVGAPTIAGDPASLIYVNADIIVLSHSPRTTTILAHEIGHAIGFRHTDYFNRALSGCTVNATNPADEGQGPDGAIHIPGTPGAADPNSWMLACIGPLDNRPFTADDAIALNHLYGTPTTVPIASGPGASYRKGTSILDVFAMGNSNNLLHRMWTGQAGWSNWVDLGGNITSEPAVISRTAATINVFAKGTSSNLLHRSFTNNIGWSSWEDLGGSIASAPAVASRGQDYLNVFARSTTNTLVNLPWTGGVSGTGWGTWQDLGGSIVDGPAAVSRQSISINVFARGPGNTLKHVSWSDGWGWSTWEDLGGSITSSPAVISRVYTTMNIFARGASNQLMHLGWNGSAGGWGTWEDLGGTLASAPAAATREENSLNVFARGTSNQLIHKWWANTTGWSAWENL